MPTAPQIDQSALGIITKQISLHAALRQALGAALKSIQEGSSKSIDHLVQEPAVMLILKSIQHCNEQLSQWQRLKERELVLIQAQEKALAEEMQHQADLAQDEIEQIEDDEIGAAIILKAAPSFASFPKRR